MRAAFSLPVYTGLGSVSTRVDDIINTLQSFVTEPLSTPIPSPVPLSIVCKQLLALENAAGQVDMTI
jgi:hypothetical protein